MKRYAAVGVMWGLAAGAVAYRYAMLPFMWSSPWRHVLPGLAAGLVVGGLTIAREGGRLETKRYLPLLIALGLASALLAFGVAYAVFPTLDRATLQKRQLPGFSLSLPDGDETYDSRDYASGKLMIKNVGGDEAVVVIGWEIGEPSTAEELQRIAEAMVIVVDPDARSWMTIVKGPKQQSLDAVRLSGKGEMLMTEMPCGSRQVFVLTGGRSVPYGLHQRILQTFECTPDPAREGSARMTSPLVIDLPGWYIAEDAPDQLQLTDGANLLFVRRMEADMKNVNLGVFMEPIFKAAGAEGTVTSREGDRVNITLRDGEDAMDGWARLVSCPDATAFVLALGTSKDNLDFLYKRVSAARCLGRGEPPQQWPSPPATLSQ